MSDRPDDISKEAWSVGCETWVKLEREHPSFDAEVAVIARAIDQARREGYAAGVRAAAERYEALTVAASSVIAEAETLAMTKRRRDVFNKLKAAYAAIRALDGEGGE